MNQHVITALLHHAVNRLAKCAFGSMSNTEWRYWNEQTERQLAKEEALQNASHR